MKALQERDANAGIAFHQKMEPRIYSDDEVQKDRIERSRKMVAKCVAERTFLTVVELGCGTLDICGPLSPQNNVYGIDCNQRSIDEARKRWPFALLARPEGFDSPFVNCDVLVLCEFLEHLPNPLDLVTAWLPLAEQVVISHPLNGDLTGDLSGGEHQWSFDESDFANWFSLGGHELVAHEVFKMEGYDIILGRGKRVL